MGLHMARLRQEKLIEPRDMCVGSPVFSTTRLSLDISVSITRNFSSSSTLTKTWWCALKPPSSRTGGRSWESRSWRSAKPTMVWGGSHTLCTVNFRAAENNSTVRASMVLYNGTCRSVCCLTKMAVPPFALSPTRWS